MAKLIISTVLSLEDGTEVKQVGSYEFDETINKKIEIEYLAPIDGGPVMRPNNPPTW